MNKRKIIESPTKIESSGWKKILMRIKNRTVEDNIPIVGAGVAFYVFLAIFPAIIAMISIYGLAVDPQLAEQQLAMLSDLMPEEAFGIIEKRIETFLETAPAALGWGTALGILVSLWSANQGTKSLFTGLDIAYDTKNERSFITHNALTLIFTLGAMIGLIISMAFIVIFPAIVQVVGLPGTIESLINWIRWPLLALIVIFGISLVYKYGPDHEETPKIRWVMLGAVIATLLWLIASWGFSIYVSNFGNYGEMYGSISAIVILMLWLFLSCFIILFGGEINSATETYAENGFDDTE